MATKKEGKEFKQRMDKFIQDLGGVPTGKKSPYYEYILDTIAGELEIRVDEDAQHCFSMFCKFKDVARAKLKFDCNPFSGKYNAMIGASKGMTVDKAVEICEMALECTLNSPEPQTETH